MELVAALAAYAPRPGVEEADVDRVRALAATADPWARHAPMHVTGSALVVDPPARRVLLRWHERMGSWLHVGGHVDPGESGPLVAARREAREETGLTDLVPWPDPARAHILHVAVVPVPAGRGEPAHEHADVRYVLATAQPDDLVPESPAARLRWLAIDEAIAAVSEDNVREALRRVRAMLDGTELDGRSASTSR
jgi:8-oxo-dGTP pyrophosphatase MutT (NUDIX family)